MNLLDHLNAQQSEAVQATEGPVLVLAGAGTGKTRVITYRIAHLIETGVPGEAILAVTFTNKAADQMKERVAALLRRAGSNPGEPWIFTFHSFCARMLRLEAGRLGLRRDFAIYDEDDQAAAVKLALAALGGERGETPRAFLEQISFAKNHGLTAEQLAAEARDILARRRAEVFAYYEEILRRAGALDFDDLLLRAVRVLRDFPDARAAWNRRFRFVLVDEFQDTNRIQYELLRLLTGEHRNLCVVGDEDQSIYSWRGADVGNILRFAEDFPGTTVIRLEQNYRSRQKILNAAGGVVKHNQQRLGKSLVATRGEGRNLLFYEARDAAAEADYVAEQLQQLHQSNPSLHLAVMYRISAQSRAFEESLRRRGLRYRVVGGYSFYQRAEVKDVLAYVRLAIQPEDDVALVRVLNTPPRGIGKASVDALRDLAQKENLSLWAAIERTIASGTARALAPLKEFRKLIEGLREELQTQPPAEFLRLVLDRTAYVEMLGQRDAPEELARAENLEELVNAVAEGEERGETLMDFLDRAALISDADSYDERAAITLTTLHSTKGLEFDHVFLAGLEEGVLPHIRSSERPEDLEEERRLCYVGMTRAKETLTLSRAVFRRLYGNERLEGSLPSRFLLEIPRELLDTAAGSLAEAGETRRYEADPEYSYTPEEFARRMQRGAYSAPRAARPGASSPRRRAAAGPANPLIGVRVRHPTYGMGTIIGVDGDDDDRKLTVSFTDYGTKRLVERFARLERA